MPAANAANIKAMKSYQRIFKCLFRGAFSAGVAGVTMHASAVTLSLSSASPIPGLYDICNLAGANMDMNNVLSVRQRARHEWPGQ
jgi:hypothetical protein